MSSMDEMLNEIEQKLVNKQTQLQLEKNFSELANYTYANNLVAFEHYFPEIHSKFKDFQPQEKFKLLVNRDGSPNIIDYDTGLPMYGDHAEQQIQQQVDQAIANPLISSADYSYLEFIDNNADLFLHSDLIVEVGKIYNQTAKALAQNKCKTGRIPGCVIFGIGLGYHILPLTEQVDAAYVSIFEPNEDYFFASLFTFDWAGYLELLDNNGSCLFLSIGVSPSEAYQVFFDRVQALGPFSVANALFFQHYPSPAMDKAIRQIIDNYHEYFMGWGFFDDALISIAHTIGNAKKNLPFIDLTKRKNNQYSDFPVFIIANGPSLDDDIAYIKALANEVIIVACNSATTALLKHGIVPDFHVALERTKETYDFLKAFIPEQYRSQINLLTLNVMHPDVADLFQWTGLGLKGREAGTSLYQVAEYFSKIGASGTLSYCNPLVGNLALSYMLTLGFKNIYLFGVDSGYIDNQCHHSKASMYFDEAGNEAYQSIKIGSEIKVAGNFVESVLTDQFLNQGRVQMERLLASELAVDAQCYNCSNGAKIDGTRTLKADNILLKATANRKVDIINYIKNTLFVQPATAIPVNDYLHVDELTKITQCMVEFLTEPVTTRTEAFEQVLKQVRFLNSLKATQYSHLFFLLEGEALYLNSILSNILYSFGDDDQQVLPYFYQLRDLWCDFLTRVPEYYQHNYLRYDEHNFQFKQ